MTSHEGMVQKNFLLSPARVEQKATKDQVRRFFVAFVTFCSTSNREGVSSQFLKRASGKSGDLGEQFLV